MGYREEMGKTSPWKYLSMDMPPRIRDHLSALNGGGHNFLQYLCDI